MPRPSLGIIVRLPFAIGCLGVAGLHSLPTRADNEIHVDDKVIPAQFLQKKKAESAAAKTADDTDDDFPYQGLTVVHAGTSSTATKKQAIAETSLDKLPAAARQRAQSLLQNTSLFRRLPTISFEVDRNVYAYFLKNPNIAVSSWRAMGISKFALEELEPQVFSADAGDGSKGTVEVFYSTPEDTMIFCEGAFKSPLLTKPIVARSLMRLRAKFHKDAEGRLLATHSADVFVEFPSQTVETVAKVISPISNSIADRNFKQLTFYAHLMTIAMDRQPGWVEAVAERMEDITPAQREEFLRLSASSYIAARQREAARNGEQLQLDDIIAPLRITPVPVKGSPTAGSSQAPRIAAQPGSSTQK